jgi:lipopolysaccharide export system protein LptA
MKKYFIAACLAVIALPAIAQGNANAPVEISAEKSLTWDRTARTYTAERNVVAKQGAAEIRSDVMVASYGETGGAAEIKSITATGNVVISSPPYKAYGDKGVYTVQGGTAVLTGGNLKIVTESETLTAQDRITYDGQKVTATGRATVVQPDKTLAADRLTAWFKTGPDGKTVTEKVTASGNIVIKTEKETVTGDEGVYVIASKSAELTGNVSIKQGENALEGARATVDMNTGLSRLFGGASESGDTRVRGVFYPKSKDQTALEKAAP